MFTHKDIFDSFAQDALKKYGLEKTCKAELLQLSENITYLIQDEKTGKKTVLRISRPGYHTIEELDSELLWLKEIKSYTPLIVADPIKGLNGSYIQLIRSWMINDTYVCILYEFLEGKIPDETDEATIVNHFVRLGETTAYLHKHAKMWNHADRLSRFVWDYDTMLGSNPRWGRWQAARDLTKKDKELLERTSAVIKGRLEKYGKNKHNFGLIHADLRLANLLIEDDIIKVIDFDDCGFGWFMHDLASAVSFIEAKPITEKLIENWLIGYQKIEPILKTDLDEIDTFIMQRRLQLLAWLTSHSDSDPVKELSIGYADGSINLAEKYLTKYN
ncbi:MAG: phosphotransferase [Flavobacteriaceae bacterium]|jgi:Ser/Thr protein kinase RdoA (MazF antagonist)|nr:phosphotransferase [Flavobacteriaceae bacterium]